MSQTLPFPSGCCTPCDDPTVVNVPGAIGVTGQNGTNGTNGINAWTTITTGFNMPAFAGTVNVEVANSTWMALGEVVWVATAGYMEVTALPDGTHVTLENIETAGGAYSDNVAPGTAIAANEKITPGGWQGPAGADATGYDPTNVNISGGVITGVAITGITDIAVADGGTGASTPANARTNLGLVIGAQVQAYDAFLLSIATLGTAADKMIYTTGVDTAAETALTAFARTLLDDATAAAANATLGTLTREGLLGTINANMASTADQTITLATGVTKCVIRRIVITNASIDMTANAAQGGIYTGPAKAGAIVSAATLYTGLTAATKFLDLTLIGTALTDIVTGSIYLSLTTASGVAATAQIFVFGDNLT